MRERIVSFATRPPEPETDDAVCAYEKGDVVRHAQFGQGIVITATPRDGDVEVTVAFKGELGIKKLLLSFAPLEKVAVSGNA